MNNIEENKNYVTPYAFGVDDALLGKPLASPARRLFSILIDTLVVGSLTLMSTTVLAACILIVSIMGSYKAKKKDSRDGTKSFAPRVLNIAAVLSGLVVAFSLLVDDLNFDFTSPEPNTASVQDQSSVPAESKIEQEIEAKTESQETDIKVVKSANEPRLINLAQTIYTDLGLGFGWAALYFSAFTAWFGGQTLGKILFRMRVVKIDGDEMSLWESFGRYGGYSAGLATGLMGFLQVIWDPNRQAIHDKISETVVIDLRKADRSV